MKPLMAAAMSLGLALSAGPVFASTYQNNVTYPGPSMKISWDNLGLKCNAAQFGIKNKNDITATVDGNTYSPTCYFFDIFDPSHSSLSMNGIPKGTLTSVLINGQSFLECNGDIYLLPGYVAPPAPIPTLSERAMILLGVVLAGGAALVIQRRRVPG